jgi:hypothetical protein
LFFILAGIQICILNMYKMDSYEIFHKRYEGFSNNDAIYTGCVKTPNTQGCSDYKAAVDQLTELKASQSKEGRELDSNDIYNKMYMSTINLGIGITLMALFMKFLANE